MKDSFIEELRTRFPVPGGGAASAHVGCVASALVEKVLVLEERRIEAGKREPVPWDSLRERVCGFLAKLQDLREEDGRVYVIWSEIRNKSAGPEALLQAARRAVECPIAITRTGCEILEIVSQAVSSCRKHLIPDLLAALELLKGAIQGASHIAEANASAIRESDVRREYEEILFHLRAACLERVSEVLARTAKRACREIHS